METTIRFSPFIAGREDLLERDKFEVTLNRTTHGESVEEINVESHLSDEDYDFDVNDPSVDDTDDDFYEDDASDNDSDDDISYCSKAKKNLEEGLEETCVENMSREEIQNMTREEYRERQRKLLDEFDKARHRGDHKRKYELLDQYDKLERAWCNAWNRGDHKRADELCEQRWKLECVRYEALVRGDEKRTRKLREEYLELYRELFNKSKEQEIRIQEDAERIKKETETISQTPESDPQVVEAAEYVRNMTEEILEQKGKLQQRNTGLEKTSFVRKEDILSTTSVKETCRNVKIYLTQVTGLVEEKIHSLPENVKKTLESLMTSFQRLLAGIWRLLVIVLLLHELEKLIVSPSFEGQHNCRRKGRLKYAFEMASMLALWLSHDVESNPGPPYNNRMSLEWLLRQLSETLKQQLKVKASLWSTQVAEAAYRAGFPRKFYWNNPSGKNSLGKKDTTETLVMKVKALGHLLRRLKCLPKDLAPLLHDLSTETGKGRLRIHCKIENLASAVEVLLSEGLTSFQKEKINQVLRKINEVTSECGQIHSSMRGQPSGGDFGPLADKTSTLEAAEDSIDLLTGNTLSLLEGRKDVEIIMEDSTSTEIVSGDTNVPLYYTGNMLMLGDSRTRITDDAGLVDDRFVQLVLSEAEDLIKDDLTSDGCLSPSGDDGKSVPPEIGIIDDILHRDTDTNSHPLLVEVPVQTGAYDPRLLTRNYITNKSKKPERSSDNEVSKAESNAETRSNQARKPDLIGNSDSLASTTNGTEETSTTHTDGEQQVKLPEDDNVNCETLIVQRETDLRLYCQETAKTATPDSSSTSGRKHLSTQETIVTRNINQSLSNDERPENADQHVVQDTNLQDSNGKTDHKNVNTQNLGWKTSALDDERGQSECAQGNKNGERSQQHTSLTTADLHMEQLREHLCQEVKNHFDEDVKNFINRCLVDLNIPTSSSKSSQPNNTQTDSNGTHDSDHDHTDEEMKRRVGQMYSGRSNGQLKVMNDIRAQTSLSHHLEAINSSVDSNDETRSSLGMPSDLDVTTHRRKGSRKRKQDNGSSSSKRRRH